MAPSLALFRRPCGLLELHLFNSVVNFQCPDNDKQCNLWTAVDLFIFILMGLFGGVLGMVFNAVNTKITFFRLKYLTRRHRIVRFVLEIV